MIIIVETYNLVGHSLIHREEEIVAFLYKCMRSDLYLCAGKINIFERKSDFPLLPSL